VTGTASWGVSNVQRTDWHVWRASNASMFL
jgi:hypothetical protein